VGRIIWSSAPRRVGILDRPALRGNSTLTPPFRSYPFRSLTPGFRTWRQPAKSRHSLFMFFFRAADSVSTISPDIWRPKHQSHCASTHYGGIMAVRIIKYCPDAGVRLLPVRRQGNGHGSFNQRNSLFAVQWHRIHIALGDSLLHRQSWVAGKCFNLVLPAALGRSACCGPFVAHRRLVWRPL